MLIAKPGLLGGRVIETEWEYSGAAPENPLGVVGVVVAGGCVLKTPKALGQRGHVPPESSKGQQNSPLSTKPSRPP